MKRYLPVFFLMTCLLVALLGCNALNHSYVKIQNDVYLMDTAASTLTELPEKYEKIGEVSEVVTDVLTAKDGGSDCCNCGDQIFQDPNEPNTIYVYTSLFSENSTFRYLKFSK